MSDTTLTKKSPELELAEKRQGAAEAQLAQVQAELKLLNKKQYEQTMIGGTSLIDIMNLADVLHRSGIYSGLKSPQYTAGLLILGRQYGLTDAQTLSGALHIVKDKPMFHYAVLLAKVRQHPNYDYRILKHTELVAEIEFYHNGEPCGVSTMTIEEARKRGTQNLDKLAKVMLIARAAGDGIRVYCPDVTHGVVYAQGEIIEAESRDVPDEPKDLKSQLKARLNPELGTRSEETKAADAVTEQAAEVAFKDALRKPEPVVPDYDQFADEVEGEIVEEGQGQLL